MLDARLLHQQIKKRVSNRVFYFSKIIDSVNASVLMSMGMMLFPMGL